MVGTVKPSGRRSDKRAVIYMNLMNDRIVIDSEIQHGRPVVRGTRVPVDRILGGLAGGMTLEEICRQYDLSPEEVRAAFRLC